MGNNPKYAMITFPANDDGLHDWYKSLCNGRKAAQVGREVFEVARLFNGSLTQAQEAVAAQKQLQTLQVLCAWRDGNTNSEQAAAVIGIKCDDIPTLWQQAVEAGKELIR